MGLAPPAIVKTGHQNEHPGKIDPVHSSETLMKDSSTQMGQHTMLEPFAREFNPSDGSVIV